MDIWNKKVDITPNMLKLIAELDEFKGSWSALGQLALIDSL